MNWGNKTKTEDAATKRVRLAAAHAVRTVRRVLDARYQKIIKDLHDASAAALGNCAAANDIVALQMPPAALAKALDAMSEVGVLRARRRRYGVVLSLLEGETFGPLDFLRFFDNSDRAMSGYDLGSEDNRNELQARLEVQGFLRDEDHCRAYLDRGRALHAKTLADKRGARSSTRTSSKFAPRGKRTGRKSSKISK